MSVGEQWIMRPDRLEGLVSVQDASVGPLNDDNDAWPERWLGDGFTFTDFSEDEEGSTETKADKWVE